MGGTGKFIINIVNSLDQKLFDLTLVVLSKAGRFSKLVSDDVKVLDLNIKRVRYSLPRIVSIIWKYRPNIVFSTMAHLNLITACAKILSPRQVKFIARESSIASSRNSLYVNSVVYNFFYRILYNRFDMIVAQSEYMKNDLTKNFQIPIEQIKVINNFVDVTKNRKNNLDKNFVFDSIKTNLIFVGRLERVKQVEILIKATKFTSNDFHIFIVGEGSQKSKLELLARQIGVINKVTFCGFQENPSKLISLSDYLILTSKYEGFPNVVLEANACGVPVIAFDCPGGVNEMIEIGINGLLISNKTVKGLAKTLNELDQHTFLRGKPLSEFIERKFPRKTLIESYQNLLLIGSKVSKNS